MAWEIVRVSEKPPGFFQEATVNVFASNVEPKLANTLVRKLCQAAPLENLRHVKRVRRRTFEGSEVCCIVERRMGEPMQFLAYIIPSNGKVSVDGVTGFTPEDSQWTAMCMKTALNLATRQLGKEVVNAALIVDPSSRQIIASAIDQTSELTSTSKIMEAFSCTKDREFISSSGSGENEVEYYQALFHLYTSDGSTRSCFAVSCLYPWRWLEQKHHIESSTVNHWSKYSWHPLRHAAIVAIENAAARDMQLFPTSAHLENRTTSSGLQDSSINLPAKKQKTQKTENEENLVQEDSEGCFLEMTRPYLCTGFDIYLVWEPCTMCAMALIHQRIRRIFYAFPNPNAGALGSIHRLQGEKSLNHHYSVYRIFPLTKVAPQ